MSRHCELFAGGENGFELKDVKGYHKWKDSLDNEFQEMLHEVKRDNDVYVYVGDQTTQKLDVDKLDTYINKFHPDGDGWDSGTPQQFWCGLSLFTKEPIELFQTDEEFPVFGSDSWQYMYRIFAKEGDLTVQSLGFVVHETTTYKKKDTLDEEILEYIEDTKDMFCDKCKTGFNPVKFNFKDRGYYEEIHKKHKYTNLCQKCYELLKKPFAEIKKLENEIKEKEEQITKMRELRSDV